MPLSKTEFSILKDNLAKAVDVDDSQGRNVPTNMNYVEEGYLIKDTGYIPVGIATLTLDHSIFYYQKKNGANYLIRGKDTKLQVYSFFDRTWYDIVGSPTFTPDAEFGYVVYNDDLYFGNAVESLYKWNGTTFTEYASAPKGNILEIFEDRLFITGSLTEKLTIYYSNAGVPTTFSAPDVLKPLGTDKVTGLVNYYGTLLLFKETSIWKLTFVYDQTVSLFVPKLEIQSNNYGACSYKAVTWVENDVWFFTGREVRSIGYKDQQIGILGVNNSVISDAIKETLKTITVASYPKISVFYSDRRFYLAVPLASTENNCTFVCHLLYGNQWTKYTGRDKARFRSATVIDGIIYTTNGDSPYGVVKWTVEPADAETLSAYLTTES
jgi:hypothetical protein